MNDEKEILLNGLKTAINTNRWIIGDCKVTIIPTELAVRLYNMLSDKEKLLWDK